MSGGAGGIVVAVAVVVVALCGAVAIHNLSIERRLRARLAKMKVTATSRIADLVPGAVAEIAGVARPLAEVALLASPLTAQPCFYFRVAIKESQGSSITHVATHTDAVDLLLDDGSGTLAHVVMKDAAVGLTHKPVEPGDEGRAGLLLAELGIRKTVKELLWFEEIIEPGAELYVLGTANAPDADEGGEGGVFRESARPKIKVTAPEDGELVVSVGDEATLATSLRAQQKNHAQIGNGFLIVTLVLGGGAAWLLLSFLSS